MCHDGVQPMSTNVKEFLYIHIVPISKTRTFLIFVMPASIQMNNTSLKGGMVLLHIEGTS